MLTSVGCYCDVVQFIKEFVDGESVRKQRFRSWGADNSSIKCKSLKASQKGLYLACRSALGWTKTLCNLGESKHIQSVPTVTDALSIAMNIGLSGQIVCYSMCLGLAQTILCVTLSEYNKCQATSNTNHMTTKRDREHTEKSNTFSKVISSFNSCSHSLIHFQNFLFCSLAAFSSALAFFQFQASHDLRPAGTPHCSSTRGEVSLCWASGWFLGGATISISKLTWIQPRDLSTSSASIHDWEVWSELLDYYTVAGALFFVAGW